MHAYLVCVIYYPIYLHIQSDQLSCAVGKTYSLKQHMLVTSENTSEFASLFVLLNEASLQILIRFIRLSFPECFPIGNQPDALEEEGRLIWLNLRHKYKSYCGLYFQLSFNWRRFDRHLSFIFCVGCSTKSWECNSVEASHWHKPEIQWSSCWQQSFKSWCWDFESKGEIVISLSYTWPTDGASP